MSPIRQQLLDVIAQTPDTDLEATLNFLQSRHHSTITAPLSTAQQAWNQVIDRFNTATPKQHQYQRQAVTELLQSWNDEPSDPEVPEESWESLKIALD
jgi:folylpolyglutamate synthase/dihydropteroate synthase